MVNPATNRMTKYEEYWADFPVEMTEPSKRGKRWCVVLVLDDAANDVRGMVIRVGQWCQGIIKARGEVSVERWVWRAERGVKGVLSGKGDWERVVKLGRLFLPCALTFMPQGVLRESKITYGDYRWEVKELLSW